MRESSLSRDLERVVDAHVGEEILVGDFIREAGDKAFGVALLMLALPGALPVPAVGYGTPFGLGILLISLQMLTGRKTLWLPNRVLRLRLSREKTQANIRRASHFLKKFERLFHPRLSWIRGPIGKLWIGSILMCLSVLVILPLPLTNTAPSMVVFALALCQMEEDGLMGAIASLGAVVLILVYVAAGMAIFHLGLEGYRELIEYLGLR